MRLFVLVFFLFPALLGGALTLNKEVTAESVLVINAKTGKVLWAKNPDMRAFPASTTKIATCFYTLMKKPNSLKDSALAKKEALVTVSGWEKMQGNYSKCPAYWLEHDGTTAGIKPGQTYSVEELLYATMLCSGNDASNVLAEAISGSVPNFMQELNDFLTSLGCTNTKFYNPHGLHHPEHVTTARDMARLAQCAMYHPIFRKIVSSLKYETEPVGTSKKRTYMQHNKLLLRGKFHYPYATGIKTGYHSRAQNALVAAAEKDSRSVIAVLFHCKDRESRFVDVKMIFDTCFKEKKIHKTYVPKGDQNFSKIYETGVEPVKTHTMEPLLLEFYPSEEPEVRCELVWDSIEAPIQKGAKVGQLRLIADDKEAISVDLFAKNEVKETLFGKVQRLLKALLQGIENHWIIATILAASGIFCIVLIRRRL